MHECGEARRGAGAQHKVQCPASSAVTQRAAPLQRRRVRRTSNTRYTIIIFGGMTFTARTVLTLPRRVTNARIILLLYCYCVENKDLLLLLSFTGQDINHKVTVFELGMKKALCFKVLS